MYCSKLAQCFPAVRVDPDPIFVRDGPVWTSAGVTAGIDLALALVRKWTIYVPDCSQFVRVRAAPGRRIFTSRVRLSST
jgi:hypothetical protein